MLRQGISRLGVFGLDSFGVKNALFEGARQFSTGNGESLKDLKTAQDYLTNEIKKKDFVTYTVGQFFPKQVRADFFSVNLLNMELSKIVETNRERSLADGKLEYWRENINDIFNDRPNLGDPIAHCLHNACLKNHLSKGLIIKLLDAKVKMHEDS